MSIAAGIMASGQVDCAEISRLMFESKSREQVKLESTVLGGIRYYFNGKCAVLTVSKRLRDRFGCGEDEIEALSSASRSIKGVLVGITIKQKDDGRLKASVRTHPPIDASEICGMLGGGGHQRAAGCEPGKTFFTAKRKLLKAVRKALEENRCLD